MGRTALVLCVLFSISLHSQKQKKPTGHQNDGDRAAQPPAPIHVIVDKLPAAPQHEAEANREQKQTPFSGWKGPDGFTALVTTIYTFFAGWTLLVIRFQSKELNRQNGLIVNKERARFSIDLAEPTFTPQGPSFYYLVNATVRAYGSTDANILRSQFYAGIGDDKGFQRPQEWLAPFRIPPVIRPQDDPIETFTVVMDGIRIREGRQAMDAVTNGADFLYCVARIDFTNVFGDVWIYEINRRFRIIKDQTGNRIGGYWERYDFKRMDGEQKIEKQKIGLWRTLHLVWQQEREPKGNRKTV